MLPITFPKYSPTLTVLIILALSHCAYIFPPETAVAPAEISLDAKFQYIYAAQDLTCGMKDNHEVYCWGRYAKQLQEDWNAYTEIHRVEEISITNSTYNYCAWPTRQEQLCWYSPPRSQKCNGPGQSKSKCGPTFQRRTFAHPPTRAQKGTLFTCGQISATEIECVVSSEHPMATPPSSDEPTIETRTTAQGYIVRFGTTIRAFSVGAGHACVLPESKRIFCWGLNMEAQVAQPCSEMKSAWINLPRAATELYSGPEATCARTVNDAVYCWGRLPIEAESPLHYRDDSCGSEPIELPLGSFKRIEIGNEHACTILHDGNVACWRIGFKRSIFEIRIEGPDYLGTHENPSIVPLPQKAVDLAVGFQHTCAILENSAIYCWGFAANRHMRDAILGRLEVFKIGK